MSETISQVDIRSRIVNAAAWTSEDERPEFTDRTYHAFVQVMKVRRVVAQKILASPNGREMNQHIELFEYYNEQLRNILGI